MRIDDLSGKFQVTQMTIHRHLDELDTRQVVEKVRSGARAAPIEVMERDVALGRQLMLPEKQAIAGAAMKWLGSQSANKVVAIDDSTTALATAGALATRQNSTVVTNFWPALEIIEAAKVAC